MDPNTVVLEISSDEEVAWNGEDVRGTTDGGDDHNWIAELLDAVNGDDCGYDDDDDDDSDEVVVVSEVLPSRKPRKKLNSSLIELDDDCVVLEHDPDKPLDVRNDKPIGGDDDDDDEEDGDDDLVVVSEKGQIACRDYPHPRHLCIKFPFSSTPNERHCDQCYCYVCDSLAPCVYWGNGSDCLNHCHATDKDEFWKLERQNSKNGGNGVQPVLQPVPEIVGASLLKRLPPMNPVPHNQVPRLNPIRDGPVSSSFGVPNIINQNRSPFLSSRNKHQPGLVSQQLIKGHHNYNHGGSFHKPLFKRTGSPGVVAPTATRYSYNTHRDNYKNRVNEMLSGSSQPNLVNTSVPFFSPTNLTFEEPLTSHPCDLLLNFQPQVNPDPYVESPVLLQPQSSMPSYSIPCEGSQQGNQGQRSTIDPKFFHDISWPQSQTNHQPVAQLEGAPQINEPELQPGLAAVSVGLVDYDYDNWVYGNPGCEPGSMDIPGSLGLNEFSPEPAFINTGTLFDF